MKRFLMVAGLSALLGACSCVSEQAPVNGEAHDKKVDDIVASARDYLKRSHELRILALNAVKNAVSAQSEKRDALLNAIKSGPPDAVRTCQKLLADASSSMDDAVELAVELVTRTSEMESMVADIEDSAKAVIDPANAARFAPLMKRMVVVVDNAAKKLGRAEKVAEELKQAWLVSAPAAGAGTTASTNKTLQSGAPAPAGK